jgi:hypothetical protein
VPLKLHEALQSLGQLSYVSPGSHVPLKLHATFEQSFGQEVTVSPKPQIPSLLQPALTQSLGHVVVVSYAVSQIPFESQ